MVIATRLNQTDMASLLVLLSLFLNQNLPFQQQQPECDTIPFGHSLLDQFSIDMNHMYLNFGSFGSVPLMVQQNQSNYRQIMNNCPDCWYRYIQLKHLNNAQIAIADYIGVEDWQNIVFIPNASNGINTILRSIALHLHKQHKKNSNQRYKLLMFSTAYPMVRNTLNLIVEYFGDIIQIIEFDINHYHLNDGNRLLAELEIFINEKNKKI